MRRNTCAEDSLASHSATKTHYFPKYLPIHVPVFKSTKKPLPSVWILQQLHVFDVGRALRTVLLLLFALTHQRLLVNVNFDFGILIPFPIAHLDDVFNAFDVNDIRDRLIAPAMTVFAHYVVNSAKNDSKNVHKSADMCTGNGN